MSGSGYRKWRNSFLFVSVLAIPIFLGLFSCKHVFFLSVVSTEMFKKKSKVFSNIRHISSFFSQSILAILAFRGFVAKIILLSFCVILNDILALLFLFLFQAILVFLGFCCENLLYLLLVGYEIFFFVF